MRLDRSDSRRWLQVVVFGCWLAVGMSCSEPARLPKASRETPIVLISIDTLRSDHLPAYGHRALDTPAIDRLRSDGILFERAYSPVPLTLPAHASLLTGLLPPQHGVRDNIGYSLPAETMTLASLLGQHGFRTGAAVSGIVLRRETGIATGFEHFDDAFDTDELAVLGEIQRAGSETIAAIEPWLEMVSGSPFFLLVHLYDPHTPYEPSEPYVSRYGRTYDGEIAAADAAVGTLLAHLDRLGIYDRAVIALTSDHGEGLFDHGEGEHGIFLYRESLQVPLVLKLPGSEMAGSSSSNPVELTDIAPTILALIGVPVPTAMTGSSLLELLDAQVPERSIYAESYYPELRLGWSATRSIIRGRYHYIEAPNPELYDLAADPQEGINILRQQRRAYGALKEALAAFDESFQQPHEADPKVQEALLSLGYLGSTVAVAEDETLPDPKDRIHTLRQLDEGLESFRQGSFEAAVGQLEKAVAQNPRLVVGWQFLGLARREQGQTEEAYEALSEAFRLSNGAPTLARVLASGALETGRLHEADEYLRLAIEDDPSDHRLRLLQGRVLIELGRLEEALHLADDLRKELPANADAVYLSGAVKIGLGQLAQAEDDLRQALELAPDHTAAMSDLAVLLVSTGRPDEARRLLDDLLVIRPGDVTALQLRAELDQSP